MVYPVPNEVCVKIPLTYELLYLPVSSIRQYLPEMFGQPAIGFFRRVCRPACLAPVEQLRRSQQRPPSAVFPAVLIRRIDEIFCHDIAPHLQARDVAVELAAHPWTVETTGSPQLACYQTVMLLQLHEYGLFYRAFLG